MSGTIDDFKAIAVMHKEDRRAAWAKWREAVAPIVAAGFNVQVINEETRHLRIHIAKRGWFDFWPSTTRWSQSRRPGNRPGVRGHGAENLLAALEKARLV